jgi:hypothetical protein
LTARATHSARRWPGSTVGAGAGQQWADIGDGGCNTRGIL